MHWALQNRSRVAAFQAHTFVMPEQQNVAMGVAIPFHLGQGGCVDGARSIQEELDINEGDANNAFPVIALALLVDAEIEGVVADDG